MDLIISPIGNGVLDAGIQPMARRTELDDLQLPSNLSHSDSELSLGLGRAAQG